MSTPPETLSPPSTFSGTVPGAESNPPAGDLVATPDNPPWGVLSAVLTWLMSMAFVYLVPSVFVLPYIAYRYQGKTGLTQQELLADKTVVLLLVLGWVPAHLLTLALIWAVATRLGKYPVRDVFGLSRSPDFSLWKSAGLAIALFLVAWLIASVFHAQPTDIDQILQSSRAAALALAVLAVATAPLVEEMVYRGLLYSALQRVIGRWFGVVIVTTMFAGLHVWQYRQNIGAILSITLLSLVLTTIRARTGRLLPCFIIHLVFNGVQSVIIVIDPYLQTLLNNWRHDASSGVMMCIWRSLG